MIPKALGFGSPVPFDTIFYLGPGDPRLLSFLGDGIATTQMAERHGRSIVESCERLEVPLLVSHELTHSSERMRWDRGIFIGSNCSCVGLSRCHTIF